MLRGAPMQPCEENEALVGIILTVSLNISTKAKPKKIEDRTVSYRTSQRRRWMARSILSVYTAFTVLGGPVLSLPAYAQSGAGHPNWPGKGELFVGTCYQPIDRTAEQIKSDIAVMKKAGFTIVRMGDLSWDSFEPADGKFTFEWFDSIMDQMQAAGIKVVLDIPGLPAPMWLHQKYPGVNIVNQQGATLYPSDRYMEDITDPDYRREAKDLAEHLMKRYANHPALLAIGYDNEIGNSYMSWSPATRARFIEWLKKKYGTLEALNTAWQTQYWSRRLSSWDQVALPYKEIPGGPAERYLDLHRFWSDATVATLEDLEAVRAKNVPDKPALSNLWDTSPRKGFDYLSTYRKYTSYGAWGFYPSTPVSVSFDVRRMKAGLDTPLWFNEFTVMGDSGDYGTPGRSRMWAYIGLIDGGQALLAWTFNTHKGGEEQALFGLLDHDGTSLWKINEFTQIASEFEKLQKLGFPRMDKPKVAIAYSFETAVASAPSYGSMVKDYIKIPYADQAIAAFAPFFNDNIDADVISVSQEDLSVYKIVVVPADYIMDQASADALRNYIKNGGTVVMTGYSAKADEHSNWFDTPLPGRLSDVFGLHTSAFNRAAKPLEVMFDGKPLALTDDYYEILQLDTAKPLATFTNTPQKSVAVSVNQYGKGRAIYVATASQEAIMGPLLRSLYAGLGIVRGPETPAGVYARVVDGRTLYVNTTTEQKDIRIDRSKHGVLTGAKYDGMIHLGKYGVDLVE
jgi:beta-galactosidase